MPIRRVTLAQLVDELTTALAAANLPSADVAHLAESTAHLAESLHDQQDMGLLTLPNRFEQAVVKCGDQGADCSPV